MKRKKRTETKTKTKTTKIREVKYMSCNTQVGFNPFMCILCDYEEEDETKVLNHVFIKDEGSDKTVDGTICDECLDYCNRAPDVIILELYHYERF